MEQNEKEKWEFSKTVHGFGEKVEDFVIPHEITVTITLHEYRELVEINAQYDLEVTKARQDYNLKILNKDKEIECLKNQIKAMVSTDEDDEE